MLAAMADPAALRRRADAPIVPFAGWGRPDDAPRGPLARALRRLGDRAVRGMEDLLGEELDARLARIERHTSELGVDPFGFDPGVARYALAVAAFFHRLWFRTEVHGIERVPEGRCLIIANHSGQLPLDGLVIGAALVMDAEPPRFPRSMVEKWSAELPFVSVLFPRVGQVVGSPDNARRLLQNDETLVVFPEGSRGISKTYAHRYQLVDFGLGFMRLALETGAPIVPVAVVGAEEQYISVADLKPIARVLGMPALPLMPQLLFGMVLPLPVKYRLYFGEPLRFEGDPDDEDGAIEEKVWVVKQTIQSMLHRGLRDRRSIFW
jgi:1-acyl-sn-glycerol-3-phosphate acyltransferase